MKNVLMVDKDVNHLAVLAVALIEAGYQVIPEIDAESAVAVLREDVRIDLIIINYQVPGLDALSCFIISPIRTRPNRFDA